MSGQLDMIVKSKKMFNPDNEQVIQIRHLLNELKASLDRTKINLALYRDLVDVSEFEKDFEMRELEYDKLYNAAKSMGIV